jgi:hypothetical protein
MTFRKTFTKIFYLSKDRRGQYLYPRAVILIAVFYGRLWSFSFRGYAVAQWLRHYATNWKVQGSILDEVNF